MKEYLQKIQRSETLSEDEMFALMSAVMEGKASEGQIGAMLMGLSMRGESVGEITGAARVLREKAAGVKAPYGAVDCCGTGGDATGTYNISTAVAIVAAACGVPMAKHGNRASSSKSGAADVLEALGVNLDAPIDVLESALKETNFAFLMAPNHHAAMKHVVPVRKSLGVRTMFNLLGPLANPAGTRLQLVGVFDEKWVMPMAETLKNLGTKRAWVVHGAGGMDEISTLGETIVAKLDDGEITQESLSPDDFGLPAGEMKNLKGGSADENAAALRSLLEGAKSPYRDVVLANAAAVLCIKDKDSTLKDNVARAAAAIDDGSAYQLLKDYIALTRAGGSE